MAQLNFNAANVAPATAYETIPAAWYDAAITESAMKPTNDKKGEYLEVVYTIASGEYVNRKVFLNLNLVNENPVAVEIANGQLSAICHAVGIMQVTDSSQLHAKPHSIKVTIVPETKDKEGNVVYEAKNNIKGFKALDSAGTTPNTTAGQQEPAPAWVTEQAGAPAPAAETTAAPAPAAEPEPTPPAPAPVEQAPPATVDKNTLMTEKANGVAYDAWIKEGWTDELLIEHEYMVAAPAAPSAAPAAPAAPATSQKPPWVK